MNKEYVLGIKKGLQHIECYKEESLSKLMDYVYEIQDVFHYLADKKTTESSNLYGSSMQFVESKGKLEVWINKPKKGTMLSLFKESKSDFLSILEDCIKVGNTYNLWENV